MTDDLDEIGSMVQWFCIALTGWTLLLLAARGVGL